MSLPTKLRYAICWHTKYEDKIVFGYSHCTAILVPNVWPPVGDVAVIEALVGTVCCRPLPRKPSHRGRTKLVHCDGAVIHGPQAESGEPYDLPPPRHSKRHLEHTHLVPGGGVVNGGGRSEW